MNESSINTVNLTYNQAMDALQSGHKVRLPEWTGYWFWENGHIRVFTRTGDVLDTPMHEHNKSRTDWQIVTTGLGFDFAILALKAGKMVQRAGWNGKGMFIFMRPSDELTPKFIFESVKSLPRAFKDFIQDEYNGETHYAGGDEIKVKFGNYLCMYAADRSIVNGWLASQTDMLAEDWQIFEY